MVSKFLADFRIMSNEERANALKSLNDVLQEMLVYGKEKVDIAVQAYCSVEEHIRSLDESLSRFEEEEFIGPSISRKSSISDRQKQQKVTPADGHASSAPSYEQKGILGNHTFLRSSPFYTLAGLYSIATRVTVIII